MRHFEAVGFDGVPRLVGTGLDADGNETLEYIDGQSPQPHAWSDDAVVEVGRLFRRFHDAARTFVPPADAVWQPSWVRSDP